MPVLIIVLGYLLGAIPAGYIAGRWMRGVDIRLAGDANVGAANAYRQLGARIGIIVALVDIAKGSLAVLIAHAAKMPQAVVLLAGLAAVIGHNWPIYLGFRGGRGVSTTIGVLLAEVTQPMLIVGIPALLALILKKNVTLCCSILFISLPAVDWWLGVSPLLIAYGIALPVLIGITTWFRNRRRVIAPAG